MYIYILPVRDIPRGTPLGWSSTENITASLGLTAETEKFIIANSNLRPCMNYSATNIHVIKTDIIKGAISIYSRPVVGFSEHSLLMVSVTMSPALRRMCAASRRLHCSRLRPLIARITSPGVSVPILEGDGDGYSTVYLNLVATCLQQLVTI